MIAVIDDQRDAIAALCRRYGVRRLELFGSAVGGAFQAATSDLDFIADFADHSPGYADRYLDFAEALETLLGHPVDVVTIASVRTPAFRAAVDAARQPVYEADRDPAAA